MNSASVREFDIAVIGGGLSGLTAAAQCAERGAAVVCINESSIPGGLVANIGNLDGYPAPTPMSGAALADSMIENCKALDVSFSNAAVTSLTHSNSKTAITTDRGDIAAKVVIVASGARLRQLGIPGEAELAGRGVSQCNWCDGGFFKNEPVFVIGGGDAAFQAALHLAGLCESVTIVIRSPTMRARRSYVQSAANNERIAFHWDTVVERIVGTDRVEGIVLRNVAEDSVEQHPAAGVFVFVGTEPNSEFLPPEIERDAYGFVVTNADYRTSLGGIFAVGGVRSGYRGPLISACGEGAAAAAAAVEELQRREAL
jgi:thioredoxin reductase (NADPH)